MAEQIEVLLGVEISGNPRNTGEGGGVHTAFAKLLGHLLAQLATA